MIKKAIRWVRTRTYQVYFTRFFHYFDPTRFSIDVGVLFIVHRTDFAKRFSTFWFRINTDMQINLAILGLGIHINSFSNPGASHNEMFVFEIPGVGLWWKGKQDTVPVQESNDG